MVTPWTSFSFFFFFLEYAAICTYLYSLLWVRPTQGTSRPSLSPGLFPLRHLNFHFLDLNWICFPLKNPCMHLTVRTIIRSQIKFSMIGWFDQSCVSQLLLEFVVDDKSNFQYHSLFLLTVKIELAISWYIYSIPNYLSILGWLNTKKARNHCTKFKLWGMTVLHYIPLYSHYLRGTLQSRWRDCGISHRPTMKLLNGI